MCCWSRVRGLLGPLQQQSTVELMIRDGANHRIIDDRIEQSIKGRQIGHNLAVVPARRHPQTARQSYFFENDDVGIVLFYSVIYNSVVLTYLFFT